MTEQVPPMRRYESEHARKKREQASRKVAPADLLALLALETSGGPIQRPAHEPGEIDRGSYKHRLEELRNRVKNARPVESSYQDEGWY